MTYTHDCGASGKESACKCRRRKRQGFDPWVRKIPWRRAQQPTPVFSPGESHGQRSLVDYSPWGRTESDMTEQLILSLSRLESQSFNSGFTHVSMTPMSTLFIYWKGAERDKRVWHLDGNRVKVLDLLKTEAEKWRDRTRVWRKQMIQVNRYLSLEVTFW